MEQNVGQSKTWARETAWALIIGLAVLAYNKEVDIIGTVVWPVTVFSLAAFGFKQPAVEQWMQRK